MKRRKRQNQKARRKLVFSEKQYSISSANDQESVHYMSPDEACSSQVNVDIEQTNSSQPSFGDVDADVMEMNLYDDYRQLDGKHYSNTYLFKCRRKLLKRTSEYKKNAFMN